MYVEKTAELRLQIHDLLCFVLSLAKENSVQEALEKCCSSLEVVRFRLKRIALVLHDHPARLEVRDNRLLLTAPEEVIDRLIQMGSLEEI